MAALIGPEAHRLAERLTADRKLWLANDNSAVQVVLSGTEPEVDAAIDEAAAAGLRVVKLPVNGAGHSPLMEGCLPEYVEALERVDFRMPRVPVYSGATARPFTDPRREPP